MTPYKELANRLQEPGPGTEAFYEACDQAAAILRSLDAQPVEAYQVMISRSTQFLIKRADVAHETATRLKDWLGSDANVTVRPLYAAPVAAVRKAMARLADLLDEDKFMEIEGIFTSAGFTPPVAAQPTDLEAMRQQKDGAYFERNQVVAALAKCFPSGVAKTAIEGWSEDWHGCVYIDLPTGQVSWHFHDSQAYLFKDLPPYAGAWDGHDTPEKYRRVNALAAAQPTREQAQRGRMATQWDAKAFDFSRYFAALQRAMRARNASAADVSQATGVSNTTLSRMKGGRRPDAASLAALSAWAGLNPAEYVRASPATKDFDLPAQSDEVAAQASKPLSDAEIESGVPMHRKGSIAFRDGVRWAEQRHGIKERG